MNSKATKEKPILFSGPMVRAILDGRKTMTRRVIKPQPPKYIDELHGNEFRKRAPYKCEHYETGAFIGYGFQDDDERTTLCPYGFVGDRLWVRETWAPCSTFEPSEEIGVIYRAEPWRNGNEPSIKWRPSIYMPRWASRITLEITGVRVERLNEISEADAIAEGIESEPHRMLGMHYKLYGDLEKHNQWTVGPKWSFETLWESINGEGSWAVNPWVWVIEFRRVLS